MTLEGLLERIEQMREANRPRCSAYDHDLSDIWREGFCAACDELTRIITEEGISAKRE